MTMRLITLILMLPGAVLQAASPAPAIFPIPREASYQGAPFVVDQDVVIAIPAAAGEADRRLARFLVAELSDRFGIAVLPQELRQLPKGKRIIVAGSVANPLVRQAAALRKLRVTAQQPGPEGYLLEVAPELVVVAGSDDAGAYYGVQRIDPVPNPPYYVEARLLITSYVEVH